MTRIIAMFPDRQQAGQAIDELKKEGIGRKDPIVSDTGEDERLNPELESYINSESEGLGDGESFAKINDLRFDQYNTILVSVEIPDEQVTSISDILKRMGAVHIHRD